ncbi:MAG: hypothetical protein ISR75_01660 [Phycisphaerales bacterium]|nr:hypothetical protein [Planctomycetota bacterium]MBL6997131.1 hypothetical protein [Phycisphaerales bacterium]
MSVKKTHKTPFIALFAVFSLHFITNTALSQFEYMVEATQPEYMARDLVVFAEGLNLDDTQEVIVEAMFDSYEDDFQAGWAATQERMDKVAEELRNKPPATTVETLEPILNALSDWLIEKRHLDDGLLENVQVILVGNQRKLWPSFAQRLYREKHISKGRLSGESVDLFQIVRDTKLSPSSEELIQGQLEEYAVALDIAMRNRDAILRGNPKKLFDKILEGNDRRSPNLVNNSIKARVEVRNLNDRYIEIISGNLGRNDSEDFRLRALKRGYTRIYRRTPAERILSQAAEKESYSEGIRAQILQLQASYLQELEIINFDLLEKTRQYEPEMHRNRELAGQVRRNGGTPQKIVDPTREVFKKREELGKRYIEMLRAILSPEQFLELDGSRRWVPQSEHESYFPDSSNSSKANKGGISLEGASSPKGEKDKDKGKGQKYNPTPRGSRGGIDNSDSQNLGNPRN